jgi:K+-transporting ATPase ATPase C chain
MFKELRPALMVFGLLSVITGVVYPLVVTGIAQVVFPHAANGSLVFRTAPAGKGEKSAAGSSLIGQPFSDPKYFWGRPSATGPQPFNGLASSGSNLGPTNPALLDAVKGRVEALRAADPDNKAPVPVDLVTASASGLDPHISPAAADYQVGRVARARGLDAARVREVVARHTEPRQLGVLGEARVNVVWVNLELDVAGPSR